MESERSEFNVAVSYLGTINVLQAYAAEAAIKMNMGEWRNVLAAMFRRVSPYLSMENYNKLNIELKNITNLINKSNTQRFGMPTIKPEVYDGLAEFEVSILRLAKAHGLISKMEEEAGSALR